MRYERLRQLRMEKGMMQTTLARSLSVSKAAISTYENGLRNPPDNTLVDMAHFFNVSVDYLLGVSDIRYAFKTSFTRDELIAAEAVILTLLDMLRR